MSEEKEEKPKRGDANWTEWVLSKLNDDEKYLSLPKVDGLRRIAPEILGKIIHSKPVHVHTYQMKNRSCCLTSWEIAYKDQDGDIVVYGDLADVTPDNMEDSKFNRFAAACSGARAEGRTWRKALGINVLTFEEFGKAEEAREYDDKKKITEFQINFIEKICKRIDVNVILFMNMGQEKYASIYDIKHSSAVKMSKYIQELQNKMDTIPESIKGYKSDWRNNG